MTKSDFSDLMIGRKYSSNIRKALEMILVDGKGQTEAANDNGLHRQAVNRALKALKG